MGDSPPRSWLSAPVFDDLERNRLASAVYPICLVMLTLVAIAALVHLQRSFAGNREAAWTLQAVVAGLLVGVLVLLRVGLVRLAAAIFSVGLWSVITGMTFFQGGLDDPFVAAFVLSPVVAGFLWGGRGVIVFSALSIAAAGVMLALDVVGVHPKPLMPSTEWDSALVVVTTLVITAVLVRISLRATERAMAAAQHNERAAIEASQAVEAGRALLETRAREQAAVAELGQVALAESDVDALLAEVVRVVARTLSVQWVSILEHLPGADDLLLRAGLGWPDGAVGRGRFPISLASQAGHTFLTGEPVTIEEDERERRFPASVKLSDMGVASSLSVVIPSGGDGSAYGVLAVHSSETREYSKDDIRFLGGIANLVALAIRRARASEELHVRNEELRQSQKMEAVGRLAGGIAHDFNNLLTAISGYTNFLLNELEEDHPGRRDAEEIQRMTEQAASLTRQILAVSRRHVVNPVVMDVNEIIANAQAMLHRVIGEDIELATDLAPDLPAVVADPGQMEQVLLNLVVNARDAMPSGGRLHVRTSKVSVPTGDALPSARVCIEVTDTGIGMDADTQARAFDPFFTTKGRFEGTGLGLSTVYGIVQQAEGTISLESRPGEGTVVRIELPASDAAPRSQRAPAADARPARGTETVLLAEDEPTVRRLMRRVLDTSGYTVLEASDGAEALALAAKHEGRIDLVITDVIMPELSGGGLAERLKYVHPEARVLYVSGYADDAIARHGVQSEDAGFLAKPFTADELSRKVRDVLDAPRG